ncbi:MAG: hypothetical protein GY941_23760 [Planctomycetes bacterium]|nr:hypothetical protein [Planctomycetota bacterium]
MTIKTTLEQLEEIQAAITKVMSGQSGSWDGKQLTMADLDSLTARETLLLTRYNSEQSGGITRNIGRVNRG